MSAEKWRKLEVEVDNPEGVSEEALFQLASYLLALDGLEPRLGQSALRFVIDGEDEGVLDRVRARPRDCAERLRRGRYTELPDRRGFLRRTSARGVLHRFGRFERATVQSSTVHSFLGASTPALPDWLWPLVHSGAVDAPTLHAVLVHAGEDAAPLIDYYASAPPNYAAMGLRSLLQSEQQTLGQRIRDAASAHSRGRFLELAVRHQAVLPQLFELLVEVATGTAESTRLQAVALLRRLEQDTLEALLTHARTGDAARRLGAYSALRALHPEALMEVLDALAEAERAQKNLAFLERLRTPITDMPSLPELPPVPDRVPLPEGFGARAREAFDASHVAKRRLYERRRASPFPPPEPGPQPVSDEALSAFLEQLETGVPGQSGSAPRGGGPLGADVPRELVKHDGLAPIHLFRLLRAFGLACDDGRWFGAELVGAFRRAHGGRPDLRELAHLAEADGVPAEVLARAFLMQGEVQGPGYAPEDAWTFFVGREPLLADALTPTPVRDRYGRSFGTGYGAEVRRENAYAVLGCFPSIPPRLASTAWEHALGSAKAVRALAQAALATSPDRFARVCAALEDGQQEVRAVAADWLADIGDPAAIGPLSKAVRREKRELPKGAMFRALEALGVDLEPYLDREALKKEAQKKLKKGIPDKLAWFPFDALPTPRWKSDDAPVARESLQWLLVTAHKLKSPQPSPLLRLYAEHWSGAEELGEFVLDAWIDQDTRGPSRDEVESVARRRAKQTVQWTGEPEQEVFERTMRELILQPLGSAQADRGVLAFPAAMGGARVVETVEAYLKRWYGWRAPQCKTLIQLLAQRDDGRSIQLLLATATRFRTKGIRKEAEQRVVEVAERRGWTPAELADRTAPTAGFELDETDGRPVLRLDLGPRTLLARLDAELSVVLDKGDGKVSKAFPKPRKDDDPTLAAAAKRAFSAAKKQAKQTVQMQSTRFYDAMCVGQRWDLETWRTYLWGHPIVGRLCERLVWIAMRGDTLLSSFRPLGDGTLTDVDDEPLELAEDVEIALAHRTLVGETLAVRWRAHLADYEITPLFPQFGDAPFELPEAARDALVLDELEGHMLHAFTLRGALTKRGYTRGSAEDGGIFHTYHRHFPTLRLAATVEFSGSSLPEENRPVALLGITFSRSRADDGTETPVPLGDVPPILLAEVHEHVRGAAEQGSGKHPDWQDRVSW